MAAARKKAESSSEVETRTTTYLAAGVGVDPYAGNVPSLDPELAKIRDAEIEKLNEVQVDLAPREPTIDPELVKIREAELKRDGERAGTQSAPKKSSNK